MKRIILPGRLLPSAALCFFVLAFFAATLPAMATELSLPAPSLPTRNSLRAPAASIDDALPVPAAPSVAQATPSVRATTAPVAAPTLTQAAPSAQTSAAPSAPATAEPGAPAATPASTSTAPSTPGALPASDPRLQAHELEGLASWYGGKFQGRLTANGERFDTNQLTAAHKTLPFDTVVKVTNLETGKSVDVRINDRGPFVAGRIIDMSRAGAQAIGMAGTGVARVRLDVMHYEEPCPYRILQIGSFGDPDNAQSLVRELSSNGLNPSIETTEQGIHRVVLTQVHTDDLETTLATLARHGYSQVLVRTQ